MKSRNKKAITPLMVSVLLITFAIAVGVVIMNFGEAKVQEEAECTIDPQLQFSNVSGQMQVCYDFVGNALKFTLENGVNVNVDGLIVNVIGTEQAHTYVLDDAKLPRAGTYLGKLEYNFATGKAIRQVKITPKLLLQEQEEICVDKAIIVENIRTC